MTAPRSDPHVQAVLAMLVEALPPTVAVCDARVAGDAPFPYVVVYPDDGLASYAAADGAVTDLRLLIQITSVGTTRQEAAGAADFARAALVGQTPVVDGRCCWPIDQVLSRPVYREDQTRGPDNLSVFTAIDQYELYSVPA
jgi:hypothetical protein